MAEDQLPYTEPLVGELIVAYAFDFPALFQMASHASIKELGLEKDEIREVAVANLKKKLPEIGFRASGPIRQIVTGETLEACTLLATNFWNQIAQETDGYPVVAVPHRDVVMFTSSRSEEGLKALRKIAGEIYSEQETHSLTDRLIAWRNGRWVEFSE